jgi:hypothetical protein
MTFRNAIHVLFIALYGIFLLLIIYMAWKVVVLRHEANGGSSLGFETFGYAVMTGRMAVYSMLIFPLFAARQYFQLYTSIHQKSRWIALSLLLFSVMFWIWSVQLFLSPSHISFDEVFFAWIAYAVIGMVCEIYVARHGRKHPKISDSDILDHLPD